VHFNIVLGGRGRGQRRSNLEMLCAASLAIFFPSTVELAIPPERVGYLLPGVAKALRLCHFGDFDALRDVMDSCILRFSILRVLAGSVNDSAYLRMFHLGWKTPGPSTHQGGGTPLHEYENC